MPCEHDVPNNAFPIGWPRKRFYPIGARSSAHFPRHGTCVTGEAPPSAVVTTGDLVLERGGRAFAALSDIHLPRGGSLAILGASGSGKTTALLALDGIRAPARGDILVEGQL